MVSDYAADQWGMVTAAQAKALDVDGVTLRRLVDSGLLAHVSRGVYGIPPAMSTDHLAERVAWLRLAPERPGWEREPLDPNGGVLSHRSAAALHDLGDLITDAVEIIVPRRRGTREPDVHLRVAQLAEGDVTRVDGLPVTTVTRTITDLAAARTDGGHLGDVIATAHQRRLVDINVLAAHLAPYAFSYGIRDRHSQRGTQFVTQLLREVGYEPDHRSEISDQEALRVARQLSRLAAPQLAGISEAIRSVNAVEPRLLQEATEPIMAMIRNSMGVQQVIDQMSEQVRNALAPIALSEEVRQSLRQAATLIAAQVAATQPPLSITSGQGNASNADDDQAADDDQGGEDREIDAGTTAAS